MTCICIALQLVPKDPSPFEAHLEKKNMDHLNWQQTPRIKTDTMAMVWSQMKYSRTKPNPKHTDAGAFVVLFIPN